MPKHNLDAGVNERFIVASLQMATFTLLTIPHAGFSTKLAQGRNEVVQEIVEAYGYTPTETRPSVPPAAAISAMDEIFGWLLFCPSVATRKILARRSLLLPFTVPTENRRPMSWRRIGKIIGADGKSVKTWHAQGIDKIRVKLNERVNHLSDVLRAVNLVDVPANDGVEDSQKSSWR